MKSEVSVQNLIRKKVSFPVSFQKIEKNKIGKDSRDGDDYLNELTKYANI